MASLIFDDEKQAFRDFYDAERDRLNAAMQSFKTLINSLIKSSNIDFSDVESRLKDREECISKFTRKYRTKLEADKTPYTIKDHITDIIGLRIVCLYEDNIHEIHDILKAEFDIIEVTNKISQIEGTEASFGYKGLHLDLRLNEARRGMPEYTIYSDYRFEIQIRTVVQDAWSIIDHKIKYKKSIPNNLKRRINTLAALFELADREFRAIRDETQAELNAIILDDDLVEEENQNDVINLNDDINSVSKIPIKRFESLNAFNFTRIAKHFFNDFDFEPHKVDGFTQSIINLSPNISRGKFNFYMKNNIGKVKQYQENQGDKLENMNPYTIVRHCLYAGNKDIFKSLLTDAARENFDNWLTDQNQAA